MVVFRVGHDPAGAKRERGEVLQYLSSAVAAAMAEKACDTMQEVIKELTPLSRSSHYSHGGTTVLILHPAIV